MTTDAKPGFEVDKGGLEKLLARRGKAFAILELIQNALDEPGVTRVEVGLGRIQGLGRFLLEVTDDAPEGFKDISHAYTLFAESAKKGNPEQRGRFNLGEKLVLACCKRARIETTTGTIEWTEERGKFVRRHYRLRREKGSRFEGEIRMTGPEAEEAIEVARRVIIPAAPPFVCLLVNGVEVEPRRPRATIQDVPLPTEVADAEGYLRRTQRQTTIRVYETRAGETPTLYEMGIPVVEVEGTYHIDIGQKIPLNSDRDGVTPAFLRLVRAHVLNATHDIIPVEDARSAWVLDALESDLTDAAAVNSVMAARYGEKRVVRDPSDPESTKLAVAQGYAVVEPGAFNRAQWDTIRRSGAVLPSGQVTPSPKPYSPDGDPLTVIPREEWTPGMERFALLARAVFREVIGSSHTLEIIMANDPTWGFAATFGKSGAQRRLVVNAGRLGFAWFDISVQIRSGGPVSSMELWFELLIHEFGHEFCSDHLDSAFHDGLCLIGARLATAIASRRIVL